MRKNLVLFLCAVLGIFILPGIVKAEKVYLKSGKTIEGKIIERKDDRIKIETLGVTLTYYKEEIDHIEEVPAATQTPEAPKTQTLPPAGIKTETSPIAPATPGAKQPAASQPEPKAAAPETVSQPPSVQLPSEQPQSEKAIPASEQTPAAKAEPALQKPQDVYREYLKALEQGNWETIKKYISKENITAIEAGGNIEEAVTMLKDLRVRDLEVIDEIVSNDQTTLIAYGTTLFGSAEGTVEMVRENGEWKVNKTNWEGPGTSNQGNAKATAAEQKKEGNPAAMPPQAAPEQQPASENSGPNSQ